MNDLRNGIIDIKGFLVGPETTVEVLESHFGIPARRNDIMPMYAFWDMDNQAFVSDGITFKVLVSFTNSKIDDVRLYPQFPEIAAKYDLRDYSEDWLPYYQELRVILDNWLEKQIGKPTRKNDESTGYDFRPLALIATHSFSREVPHGVQYEGGKINIWYE